MDVNASDSVRWGFIGAGRMASALVEGMIRRGVAPPGQILASDPSEAARRGLAERAGIRASASNREVASQADVLILAVKPQVIGPAMAEVAPALGAGKLVVSIAAGITIATLRAGLGESARLVRVMPNTPALVGAGASGYCMGETTTQADEILVGQLLQAVGRAYRVPESLIDAVTGLSGSGPAFVYAVIEALSDGGVRAGLPRDVATPLAAQTVLGAALMVLETGLHPGALKDQVTSPGGTTIAGLHALERGGLRAALMDAVEAAARRASELGAGR